MENRMNSLKKLNLIAPILISFLFTPYQTHTMKRLPKENPQWVELVGNAILGESTAIEPSSFMQLPTEIQATIISLLASNSTATTLQEAAKTINSLAQVNYELNELMNDS